MQLKNLLNLTVVGGAVLAAAHPGHHEEPTSEIQSFKRDVNHGLRKCATKFERSGLHTRAEARRKAMVELHRRQLTVRDTDAVLNKSHHVTGNISPSTSDEILFGKSNVCLIAPEGETGPYWIPGEHVRSNIRESESGVPVVVEQQYVDVETCEPIHDLYAEIWGCNATGVYSGLVADGNGNAKDLANHNRTFLRGIQPTNEDGVVTFETIFPGHYDSRTTHYHNVAHINAQRLPNNTIAGGSIAHIGQIFWDQDLISKVESTYPYNTNNIPITLNADDRVVNVESENSDADPMLSYAFLGDKIEDGIFAWITVGVNTSALHYPYYTNVYTGSGGIEIEGTDEGSPRAIDGGLPQTSSSASASASPSSN